MRNISVWVGELGKAPTLYKVRIRISTSQGGCEIKYDDEIFSAEHNVLHMVSTQQMLTVIAIMVILIMSPFSEAPWF